MIFYYYWFNLNNIATRFFLASRKKQYQFTGKTKYKYQRVSLSKKLIIKNKSTSLLVVLQLQLTNSLLSNTPPLSTLLNFYGLNVQKFCDDISNDLKNLPIFDSSFILKIFILKDLSYKYIVYKFKAHVLIKFFFYNIQNKNKLNLYLNIYLRSNSKAKRQLLNTFEILRNYYFVDMFLFIHLLYCLQNKLIYYNNYYNKLAYFDSNTINYLTKENLFNNYFSLLKSLNVRLKRYKNK